VLGYLFHHYIWVFYRLIQLAESPVGNVNFGTESTASSYAIASGQTNSGYNSN